MDEERAQVLTEYIAEREKISAEDIKIEYKKLTNSDVYKTSYGEYEVLTDDEADDRVDHICYEDYSDQINNGKKPFYFYTEADCENIWDNITFELGRSGRGYYIATDDQQEIERELDGEKFYIYRTN